MQSNINCTLLDVIYYVITHIARMHKARRSHKAHFRISEQDDNRICM